jgi:hypothetical protein
MHRCLSSYGGQCSLPSDSIAIHSTWAHIAANSRYLCLIVEFLSYPPSTICFPTKNLWAPWVGRSSAAEVRFHPGFQQNLRTVNMTEPRRTRLGCPVQVQNRFKPRTTTNLFKNGQKNCLVLFGSLSRTLWHARQSQSCIRSTNGHSLGSECITKSTKYVCALIILSLVNIIVACRRKV